MSGDQARLNSHGRGGAGNINSRPENSGLTAADLETPTIKTKVYTTGRGGTGNMATNDLSNPEAARNAQDVTTPAHHERAMSGTHHWGRGGEGNMMSVGQDKRPQSKERMQSKERVQSKERTSSKGANGERRPSLAGLVGKSKEFLGLNKKAASSRMNESAMADDGEEVKS